MIDSQDALPVVLVYPLKSFLCWLLLLHLHRQWRFVCQTFHAVCDASASVIRCSTAWPVLSFFSALSAWAAINPEWIDRSTDRGKIRGALFFVWRPFWESRLCSWPFVHKTDTTTPHKTKVRKPIENVSLTYVLTCTTSHLKVIGTSETMYVSLRSCVHQVECRTIVSNGFCVCTYMGSS